MSQRKLTNAQIDDVRRRKREGQYSVSIARVFDVSETMISRLTRDIVSAPYRKKLSIASVKEIRRRAAAGESYGDIAADFSVDPGSVSSIARRNTWADLDDGFPALSKGSGRHNRILPPRKSAPPPSWRDRFYGNLQPRYGR